MITTPPATPRTRRDERGSVLVFVVGVLVLLALAATAYLSTARVDRVTTKQNEFTTQIDLLLEGVRQATIATLLNDPSLEADATKFKSSDYFGNKPSGEFDSYLATRVPTLFDPQNPTFGGGTVTNLAAAAAPNPGLWRAITGPLITGQYESPSGQVMDAVERFNVIPFAGDFAGRVQPALVVDHDKTSAGFQRSLGPDFTALGNNLRFAGDADGDGIADSFPEKLPVGKINGIEYFAYVRIIDNNSAINVNTAMSRDLEFSGGDNQTFQPLAGTMYPTLYKYGFFSSDIGLAEMLRDYTEPAATPVGTADLGTSFNDLLRYRTNKVSAAPATVAASAPVGDASGARTDFTWMSLGDLFHHQITMRQYFPGLQSAGTRFQTYSASDGTALARKFVLTDNLSTSDLETTLGNSLLNDPSGAIPSAAFDPATAQTLWFPRFFHYYNEDVQFYGPGGDANTFLSRRPLFVTESNTRTLLPTDARAQTILAFNADATPKANINTASLPELYRAFYMTFISPKTPVVADNMGTIYDTAAIVADYGGGTGNPYKGMGFTYTDAYTPHVATTTESHAAGVLRSPIRSTPREGTTTYDGATNIRIEAAEMAKLRAAIAAVNADAMRRFRQPQHDSGTGMTADVIVPQDVEIRGKEGSTNYPLTVRVFGISRQPYITEVFAHTEQSAYVKTGTTNANGYIAIELYNPHDFPIDISNCRFGAIMRHRDTSTTTPWSGLTPFPRMIIEDMSKLPTTPSTPPLAATGRTEVIRFLAESGGNYVDATPADGLWDIDPAYVKSNTEATVPTDYYTNPLVVPARGYLILENYDVSKTDAAAAAHRPGSVIGGALLDSTESIKLIRPVTDPGVNAAYVKNLHLLMNREFVLMRPTGAIIANEMSVTPPPLPGAGVAAIAPTLHYRATSPTQILRDEFMPLDSFDLSGLMLSAERTSAAMGGRADNLAWHYGRQTPTYDSTNNRWTPDWQFVYPGRYDAAKAETHEDPITYSFRARQQGTNQTTPFPLAPPDGTPFDPWDRTIPTPNEGTAPNPAPNFGAAPAAPLAQDKVFTIKLFDKDWPGPLTPGLTTPNFVPFGQFARPGDIYQVPFIGAYTIIARGEPAVDRIIEMNAVTMDAAMAEDTDVNTDPQIGDNAYDSREQIGRFIPLRPTKKASPTATETTPHISNDPESLPTGEILVYDDYRGDAVTSNGLYRYAFGRRLLDYLTVDAPHDDYLPNAAVATYGATPAPEAVSNSGLAANSAAERKEARHGLININTASWKVLAMIPWVPARDEISYNPAAGGSFGTNLIHTAPNFINDNEDFAKAFVEWRDGNVATNTPGYGPIESLADLYRCPAFLQLQSTSLMGETELTSTTDPTREPGDREGDISPFDPTIPRADMSQTDGIRYDFEEQTLLLNRVSNLITTRSDTFTVYILLQGWRNAGSAAAELVVERRAAMIVDRSSYTPSNGTVSTTRVPTN